MQKEDAARLTIFVEATKQKGASDELLATLLIRHGWPADDVYTTLGRYWERLSGVPVPERGTAGESAKDAFLYLLSFCTLATWASALGAMIFELIDHWLPDAVSLNSAADPRTFLTWQMASLAVTFPIYLLAMRLILREAAKDPERLQSGVRKWLTYIALLGTAGTMICDLIWSLGYFLSGELTTIFVLKATTVMIICGSIFTYYVASLRWSRQTKVQEAASRSRAWAIFASVAVIATFAVGLGIAGTPSRQRLIEADNKRVRDLSYLASEIKAWHDRSSANPQRASIPAVLTELQQVQRISIPTDPETDGAYEYQPQSTTTYQLCANFATDDEGVPQGPYASKFWRHAKGRSCFLLDASNIVP